VLLGVQVLVAEEDDPIFQDRRLDGVASAVAERLGEIDAQELGADLRLQRIEFKIVARNGRAIFEGGDAHGRCTFCDLSFRTGAQRGPRSAARAVGRDKTLKMERIVVVLYSLDYGFCRMNGSILGSINLMMN
jgi:hypothetical protein